MSKQTLYLFAPSLLILACVGCQPPTFVTISPRASEVQASGSLDVGATIRNPVSDVSYQWSANTGRFTPQQTSEPKTTYVAPSTPGEDRIRLQVMSGSRIIASDERIIRIVREAPLARLPADVRADDARIPSDWRGKSSVTPTMRFTTIPPHDPVGGPTTAESIGGSMTGGTPSEYRVVVYAYTDRWYVQPLVGAPFTPVAADGRWSTWTHLGARYAALLVHFPSAQSSGYTPAPVMDALPAPGGPVVSVELVEGMGAAPAAGRTVPPRLNRQDQGRSSPRQRHRSRPLPRLRSTSRLQRQNRQTTGRPWWQTVAPNWAIRLARSSRKLIGRRA